MAGLLGKLKGNSVPATPVPGASPGKKATAQTPSTPLEKWLVETGPPKGHGTDKYFGMHNPSNTCYCNSVVQCLYFSEPFREQVVNFPRRAPKHFTAENGSNGVRLENENSKDGSVAAVADPSNAQKNAENSSESASKAKTPSATPTVPNSVPPENKESFEYQKKAALAAGPHIRLEQGFSPSYEMPESLFTSLKDIFEAIIASESQTGIVTPAKFLEILRRNHETFRSNIHQDAHEFLNILLNEVVEQVEKYSKSLAEAPRAVTGLGLSAPALALQTKQNTRSNSSWVHELFEGTLTSETRCLTCENISQQNEAFLDLSVDLEEHSSVTSCLSKFSEEEMLCERNKFHCDMCGGLQEAEKRMKIKRLPRILALHLKRFKFVEEIGTLRKLFHRVVYPFHLRLLNTTDDAEDPDRLYELYAVVVHLGTTPFHGHYVSIIKSKDRGWLLFDDELVLPVDKEYVRNFFGGDPRNPACAYVLFYQETTMEAVQREQETQSAQTTSPLNENNLDASAVSSTLGGDEDHALPIAPTPAIEESDPMANLTAILSAPAAPEHSAISINSSLEKVSSSEERQVLPPSAKPAPATKSGHVNRWKNSSLSIRSKSKLFASKNKAINEVSEQEPFEGGQLQREVSAPAAIVAEKLEKDKSKGSRFGLGKKKSAAVS